VAWRRRVGSAAIWTAWFVVPALRISTKGRGARGQLGRGQRGRWPASWSPAQAGRTRSRTSHFGDGQFLRAQFNHGQSPAECSGLVCVVCGPMRTARLVESLLFSRPPWYHCGAPSNTPPDSCLAGREKASEPSYARGRRHRTCSHGQGNE